MYSLARPDRARIEAFLAEQAREPLSYGSPGITERAATQPGRVHMEGYVVGRAETALGRGRDDLERAIEAMRSWRMFPPPVEPCWPDAPIAEGTVVAVLGRPLGIWSLNALRVIQVIDEDGDERARFGFAYGTLPEHAVRGEERFVVEWSRATDEVRYSLVACSRQGKLAARLAAPLSRLLQERFRASSALAMRAAMEER